MNFEDFRRLIDPIKRKIFLLIGRAILTAIDNSGKTMKVQLTALKDETISDVERFEEFGLASYPKLNSEAEAVVAFINGNRDHGIVLCIHDRSLRPADLAEGDVCLYDMNGNRIWISSGNIKMLGATESFVLGDTAKTKLDQILTAITQLQTDITTWVAAPNDGGAALKALTAAGFELSTLPADLDDILSTKIKGE